jgi:tRNA G26 N,N-dimethylase Trm1
MQDFGRTEKRFDVIDLDPYGSAMPFVDSALRLVKDNGLLCATFTDMRVLCSKRPGICYQKYGAAPHAKSYCKEEAMRMALYAISCAANRIGCSIEPFLSVTVDFYIRLFVKIH